MEYNTAILMAVHNGQKFLAEQIESILQQTYANFDLIIQDDGSTDDSMKIINDYCQKDKRVVKISFLKENKGAVENFSSLFNYAKDIYDYIFFSDQDDVWDMNKVKNSMEEIKKYDNFPALVFTNFYLWKSDTLKKIYEKKVKYSFERCISQNVMYGCTMMVNKKMIDIIDNIPLCVENHDYWIALLATLNDSSIIYLEQPMLKHRLHEENVTARSSSGTFKGRVKALIEGPLSNDYVNNKFQMWINLYDELAKRYNEKQIYNLNVLIQSYGFFDALRCIRIGFKGVSIRGTLFFFLTILLRKRTNYGKNKI